MKKPTTEMEFDLVDVRDIKRLLNRAVKKIESYERTLKKRIREEAQPEIAPAPPLPLPEPPVPPAPVVAPKPKRKPGRKSDGGTLPPLAMPF